MDITHSTQQYLLTYLKELVQSEPNRPLCDVVQSDSIISGLIKQMDNISKKRRNMYEDIYG